MRWLLVHSQDCDSPFLASSFLTPSCHTPPNLHLQTTQRTSDDWVHPRKMPKANSGAGTKLTWIWEDDITVIQRFAVVHLLLFILLAVTPIWTPALCSAQLLQLRLSVLSVWWATASLIGQPEPQHAFLWEGKIWVQRLMLQMCSLPIASAK